MTTELLATRIEVGASALDLAHGGSVQGTHQPKPHQ
jgi:hypothetical protein